MKGTKDMAKLVFNYGAMGSSKTANALMVAYNYEERGQHALILKPATDTRDGIHTVSSRIGLSNTCRLIDEFLDEFTKNPEKEEIDRLESILENFKKKTSGGV